MHIPIDWTMKDVFSPLRDAVFGIYEVSTMNIGIARIFKEGRRFRHEGQAKFDLHQVVFKE